ncbi:hypothetical protein MJO28_006527 [Puccinia striiformis f. sp. tritici]|uniref:Uncharacterized protein n=1 Tax=Puccinia striiformis f. sp. tritici TaxID=168172 RepID=A0ACC0EHQ5_9BASI|nr:hypothetical protein MJO28_006527 [Puccinia striiformis f. sp. tritici]
MIRAHGDMNMFVICRPRSEKLTRRYNPSETTTSVKMSGSKPMNRLAGRRSAAHYHKGEADVIDLLERESINDIVPFVAERKPYPVTLYSVLLSISVDCQVDVIVSHFFHSGSRRLFENTMSIPIFISATVICVAGMMICIVYSKNMILAHDNLMLGEDKIRLEKENENNKSRLEKENENNKSRLEKENENNKSRLEKENQDNKIRWEKENSKLDTELKEVKAKHGQIISPDYKIIIKLVLQGLKLDCDVSSIHRYTLLEKENENNKSRLEKENQDNKIRWEKENSKLDTELKEVKAKHGQIISPDYKIIIKLVLQGLKLDCDVSSIHRYTL